LVILNYGMRKWWRTCADPMGIQTFKKGSINPWKVIP